MDAITIERAQRGDRQAVGILLRHLQDPWFRVCRSLLIDQDLARDATQETALRFLRDLRRFRGESSLVTWSIGIAINVSRELRRSLRPTDPLNATIPAAGPTAGTPHENAVSAERHGLLRSALGGLSERQHEAIVLRYFEDLSVEETAAAMGCAPGTVKATVHQALRVLRNKLRKLT